MNLKPHIVPCHDGGRWVLNVFGTWRNPFTVAEQKFFGARGQSLGDLIRVVGRLDPQPEYYPCWFTMEGKRSANL